MNLARQQKRETGGLGVEAFANFPRLSCCPRDLYRTLETPGTNGLRDAQAALDSAVRAAYGMKENEDTLAFLLHLNLELANMETKGETITPPGLPAIVTPGERFISPDCIQAA